LVDIKDKKPEVKGARGYSLNFFRVRAISLRIGEILG